MRKSFFAVALCLLLGACSSTPSGTMAPATAPAGGTSSAGAQASERYASRTPPPAPSVPANPPKAEPTSSASAADDLIWYGQRVGDHPSLHLTAEQQNVCQRYRPEWVRNYMKQMYEHKFNGAPADAVNRSLAGYDPAVHAEVDRLGLSPEHCRVPECYSIPRSGWWEPHCGYRIPNAAGENLYSWVEWHDGVQPPDLRALAERKEEELRANLRGCPTCTGKYLRDFRFSQPSDSAADSVTR